MESINNIYSTLTDYLTKNNDDLLKDKQVFELLNKLSSIKFDKQIDFPEIIVVGTQSSAKSSLLNSIMGINILPTNSKMCSKNPCRIELLYNPNSYLIQIGQYEDGIFKKDKFYDLKKIESENILQLQKDILSFSKKVTTSNNNVSTEEMVIKIQSPNVANLTLIDLPGIINVALDGQDTNIKQIIRNMINKYASNPNTIILSVMPSRVDLEVDQALEIVKELDPNNERSIGILTKPDLMSDQTDISNYLIGNISNNLKLKYGYYTIKNKISEDDISETEYFNNHKIYSKLEDKSRLGVVNLSLTLSNILLNKIREYIPDISCEVNNRLIETEHSLVKFKKSIPDNISENKDFIINLFITNFSTDLNNSIENKSIDLNYGRSIKQNFVDYRNEINNLKILDTIDDKLIEEIIDSSEGNKMEFIVPLVDVLEKTIQDRINPILQLRNPSLNCLEKTNNTINNLISELLNEDNFVQFPNLKKKILEQLNEDINLYKSDIIKEVNLLIETERNYIWSEDSTFKSKFNELKKEEVNLSVIKNVIDIYYNTVIQTFGNYVPKLIMYFLINNIKKNTTTNLLSAISNEDKTFLLTENNEIFEKRIKLETELKNLSEIKELLSKI